MPDETTSPSGSMAGWSLRTLLAKNKDKIKLLVSAIGAYLAAQTGLITDPALNTLVSTAVGVVVYVAGSAIDYWLTDSPS